MKQQRELERSAWTKSTLNFLFVIILQLWLLIIKVNVGFLGNSISAWFWPCFIYGMNEGMKTQRITFSVMRNLGQRKIGLKIV